MSPTRSAMSVIEMVAVIALVLPLAGMALGIATKLAISHAPVSGAQVDLLCEQLRRDAAGGVRLEADALLVGRHRWVQGDGWLSRDGARRIAGAATWRQDGAAVTVELRPAHLPARQLLLQVRP